MSHTGQLDCNTHPADRITPSRVGAYLADLAALSSTATQRRRLEELFIVASLLDPRRSWQWIRDLATRVRWRDMPVRDKRSRLVGADDLLNLGHQLMQQAEQAEQDHPWCRALLNRDGLALALLAQRPLRRANFAGLRLGQHVLRRGAGWWLQIEAEETKTRALIEVPWPETLVPALEVYLTTWRPVLLARRISWSAGAPAAGTDLSVSSRGAAMGTQALYDMTTKRTRLAFGKALSPHLFRDCAATSIAIEDPVHVRIASQVLGHRSQATTERYYNQAQTIDAARQWQATLDRMRASPNPSYATTKAEDAD
ncbi:tyrosine-type recombinase/integrase [Paeniroseomonas aquatica]|uniref:Site-specific integrase n=1 Tax=Paeniroseomonas aquatica TaxID=373043 RepID=A0ABT8AF93_9PROT|nr:site-specific integrase [Paeniroseomonas aquatica]MDN3568487.1 site-specific integrase [Paeniroseomonas aquatica]